MKTILASILLACALIGGGCSDKQPEVVAPATPVPNVKADADRLQEATAKAAERRQAELAQSPTPTPTPGAP